MHTVIDTPSFLMDTSDDCSYVEGINVLTVQLQTVCQDDEPDAAALHTLGAVLIDTATANRLSEVFKALSDPTRLRIISLLLEHEVCVHTLELTLGMTQSAISHQLRLLRQLHLVRYRKAGRHVFYTLDDDHVRDLFAQGLLHVAHG